MKRVIENFPGKEDLTADENKEVVGILQQLQDQTEKGKLQWERKYGSGSIKRESKFIIVAMQK